MSALINRLVSPFSASKFSSLSESTLNQLTLNFTETFYKKSKLSLMIFAVAIAAIATVNFDMIMGRARLWLVLQLAAFTCLLAWVFLLQQFFSSANLRLFTVLLFQFANALFLSWGICFLAQTDSVLFYNVGVLVFIAVFFAFLNRDNYKLYVAFLIALLVPVWFAVVEQGPMVFVAINLIAMLLFKINHSLFTSEKEVFLLELVGKQTETATKEKTPTAKIEKKVVEESPTADLVQRLMPVKAATAFQTWRIFNKVGDSSVFSQGYLVKDYYYLVILKAKMSETEALFLYSHVAGYLQSIFHRVQNAPVVARLAQHMQGYLRKRQVFEKIEGLIIRLDDTGLDYVVAGDMAAYAFNKEQNHISKLEKSARSISSVIDITLAKRRQMQAGDKVVLAFGESMKDSTLKELFSLNEVTIKDHLEKKSDEFVLFLTQTQWKR